MAQIRLIGTDPSQVPTNGMLGNLAFQNAESVSLEKLVVTGDVGIGTLTPASRLEIVGNASSDSKVTFSRVPVQSSNDGVIGELFFQNNTDSIALISVKRQSAADDAYIQFATQQSGGGLTERLRITSTGTLNLVGAGTAGSTQAISFSGSAPVNSLVLDSSGRVGIGTTNPIAKLHVVGSTELSELNLSGISSSISSTAVDVFVYDTRKDSDGGAWRKRTQHTSWYNETLNTATRGARKEFPAVAVIVIEGTDTSSSKIKIYDGDDPDMPMWMIFNGSSYTAFTNSTITGEGPIVHPVTLSSVFALNGTIAITSANYVLYLPNFISDVNIINVGAFASYSGGFASYSLPISGRNSSGIYTRYSTQEILAASLNDVAMTVLPNAPIDPSTGLPVPTIAVATAAGVSIIKDNGTVENTDNANIVRLGFIKGDRLAYGHRAEYAYAGVALNVAPFRNSITYGWYIHSTVPSFSGSDTSQSPGVVHGVGDGDVYAWAGSTGGIRRINENITSSANGMANYITSSYNTGWMHGDIKGAWLSDTSTASVTGTELITNGNFSTSDLSAWTTIDGGTAVITGGLLKLTDTSNAFVYASAPFTTVVGKQYVVTFDIVNNGNNTANYNWVRIGNSHNSTALHNTNYGTAYGKYQVTITATATTTYITLINGLGNGLFGYWDNVSARLAEPDRSVNNKGLAVYGTITKTAVATGANLVGYSGFSESDYLKQPHNSSLEFGTGSFSCTVWFKSSTADGSYYKGLVYLNRNGSIGEGFQILLTPSNDIYFYIYGPTNDFDSTQYTGYNDGNWHQISVSSTGTHQRVYLDGVLKETGNITTGSITDTSSELFIGKYGVPGYQFYWRGSIALCRISASIPSPEQILKIYNDEKMLFQENSQATLYGASDAVTALAYDDTTDLLSVGTSSGRSDFSGLKRINNTTTAVTTAISASNGLIAEQ